MEANFLCVSCRLSLSRARSLALLAPSHTDLFFLPFSFVASNCSLFLLFAPAAVHMILLKPLGTHRTFPLLMYQRGRGLAEAAEQSGIIMEAD